MTKKEINWNLSDLFKTISDPKIQTIIRKVQKDSSDFQKNYKEKIKNLSSKELAIAYKTLEKILSPLYKVSQFASLSQSTDIANNKIKALVNQIDEVESSVSNTILFFDLELGKLPQSKINAHLKMGKCLDYGFHIIFVCLNLFIILFFKKFSKMFFRNYLLEM